MKIIWTYDCLLYSISSPYQVLLQKSILLSKSKDHFGIVEFKIKVFISEILCTVKLCLNTNNGKQNKNKSMCR